MAHTFIAAAAAVAVIFGAPLGPCSAGGSKHSAEPVARPNDYSSQRLARICDRLRRAEKSRRRGDVLDQIEFLLDEDPWVRQYAYRHLLNETNLLQICQDLGFADFDPWGKPQDIRKHVTAFSRRATERKDKVIHEGRVADEQRLKEIAALQDDEWMRDCLIGMARHRLDYYGDKRAMYPLIALLNHGSIHTRAKALTGLMGVTETVHFWPKEGLKMGAVDPDVLERTKAKWLAWWRKHEATFVPRGIW